MADQNNRQPTAESQQSVEIILSKTMKHKSPTGKSNYLTIKSGRMTITNYINGLKTITNRKYRRIQPND